MRRKIIPAAVVLLALCLCCAGVSRAASRIIFVSGGQLYSMLPDGSLLTSLTTGGARSPIVNRDRQTVAFISPTGIACYDAASTTIRTIPMARPPSNLLCFTPDARRIYFTRDITVKKSPTVAVFSIAIDGRDERTCHGKPGEESWVSPFSPDGRWLVTAAGTGLVRVSPDGKLRRAVPLGKKQQEFESLLDPTYSPDGAHIAFCWTTSGDYVHGELYLVRADGSALTNPAPLREEKPAISSIFYPCFSPNGKQLAFIGWEMWGPDPETETQSYLWVVGIGGDGLRRLAKFGKTKNALANPKERDFSFSPDGKSLAFVSGGDIWTVDTDGANLRQLTKRHQNSSPCWVSIQ